jgi:biopolymer transport protein ExbD/biopolymer transport protein TolR
MARLATRARRGPSSVVRCVLQQATDNGLRTKDGFSMAFTTAKGRTRTSLSEINVTPFVDVMMVLLVIFMITAPLLESGIEVDLPKTKTVKVVTDEKVVVTIDKRQTIYVGNDPVNIHRLASFVLDHMQGASDAPVYIRCDQSVPFGAFAQVVDALKQANLTNISIVTEPLSTRGTS